MFDVLIKNGKVVDGSGAPWLFADVAIAGDKIAAIGRDLRGEAKVVIDAKGKMVCPGFIDIHTHSDTAVIRSPERVPKVSQGVTTEVFANCGLGCAPVNARGRDEILAYDGETYRDIGFKWLSVAEYLNGLPKMGINAAYLVPHGALRASAMGYQARPASDSEVEIMAALLDEGMADGAYGFTTGLAYVPMTSATTGEVIALSKVAAKRGGFLASHMRNYLQHVKQSVEEMVKVAEEAELPVQISHYQAYGEINRGRGEELVEWLDKAREKGLDITFDSYPYDYSAGFLRNTIPAKYHEGGASALIERLREPAVRAALRTEIGTLTTYDLSRLAIASSVNPKVQEFAGIRLPEAARQAGVDVLDFLCDLLIQDTDITHANFSGSAADCKILVESSLQMPGSDSIDVIAGRGKPHPRLYGTMTRFLRLYAVEEKVLSLEEAVRRMTSFPAWRMGFLKRGLLKPGFFADIVVFDPEKVSDRATIESPEEMSSGIEHVLVNGTVEFVQGKMTGQLGGRVLRKGVD